MFVHPSLWLSCGWFGSRLFSASHWVQSSFLTSCRLNKKQLADQREAIWTDFVQPHRLNPSSVSCKSKQMCERACRPVITPLLFSALTAGCGSPRCPKKKKNTLCSTTKRANTHTHTQTSPAVRCYLLPSVAKFLIVVVKLRLTVNVPF